jgi:hypothetical protein
MKSPIHLFYGEEFLGEQDTIFAHFYQAFGKFYNFKTCGHPTNKALSQTTAGTNAPHLWRGRGGSGLPYP